MDYRRFVASRRPLWEALERDLEAAGRRPRELDYEALEGLAVRFRQVLHDHALAAARYPGTGAARRLARLSLEGTHWLLRDATPRRGLARRFLDFWSRSFPATFRRHLPAFGVALGLFLAATLFGLALTVARPEVGRLFLGPEAVEGLRHGEIWTRSLVHLQPQATASSIALNNIGVAVTGWAGGALAGLGAFYVLLLNGFLLGSLIAFTAHYSMAGELLVFVAAHGPLEISLILFTCGAGLAVGRALVVAGDRPRGAAVAAAARDSFTLLAGCLPWFLALGVVEVLISPHDALPPSLKAAAGLALLALFLAVAWNPFLPPGGARESP